VNLTDKLLLKKKSSPAIQGSFQLCGWLEQPAPPSADPGMPD
jgi:hypothetical protein